MGRALCGKTDSCSEDAVPVALSMGGTLSSELKHRRTANGEKVNHRSRDTKKEKEWDTGRALVR